MSIEEAKKKLADGDKRLKKGWFSRPEPDRAISLYEDAYKILKRLGNTKDLQTLQIQALEKQAAAEVMVDSYFKAGQCYEYAANIILKRDGEGKKTHIDAILTAADRYAYGSKAMKACQMYLKAANLMEDSPDELVSTVDKLVTVCEDEKHSTFSQTIGPAFSLLVKVDRLDSAIKVLRRENALFRAAGTGQHYFARNLLSETVLLLSMGKREEARKVVSSDEFYQGQTAQWKFGKALLSIFDKTDQDALDALQAKGRSEWLLLGGHAAVSAVGRKMGFGTLKAINVATGDLGSPDETKQRDGTPDIDELGLQ